MSDYISRDYAVENMENFPWDTEHDRNAAIHLVRELVPAADVRPVVRATWVNEIRFKTECGSLEWHGLCSQCLTTFSTFDVYAERMNFCPYCGADMREKTDSSLRSE